MIELNDNHKPISATKEKIYLAAAKMFAEYGYDNVSMRDLAKEVGITNSSVYNHFSSKKDIRSGLFRYYTEQRKKYHPDLERLLELAETEPPHKVLEIMEYHFPPDIEEFVHYILAIAAGGISTDPECMQFIKDNVFAVSDELTMPVLKRMAELGKIEPVDIESFNEILMHYCFSAVALNATPMKIDFEKWQKGLKFLFSFLTPKVQTGKRVNRC